MGTLKLEADLRDASATNNVNNLREAGFIPAVVYGGTDEPQTIKLKKGDLKSVFYHQGTSGLLNLELENEVIPTIVKDIQMNAMNNKVLHVDFQRLSAKETIKLTVPIHLIGRDEVETTDALIQYQLTELEIACYPKDIPSNIEGDASKISFGSPLRVKDLKIVKNPDIQVFNEMNEVIATLVENGKPIDEELNQGEEEVEPVVIGAEE